MKSAIYKITCLKTMKFYIGSAVDVQRRFLEHKSLLRRGIHYNPKLQNAWNKYGEESFYFDVVQFVDEDDLLNIEQDWIDKSNALTEGFNLAPKAGAGGSCKEFIVTLPDGQERLVSNLSRFAREHNVSGGGLHQVARGLVNQCKGFKVRFSYQSLEDWQKTVIRPDKHGPGWKGQYLVTHPDGTIEIIKSLTAFCKSWKLSQGDMASICRGERKNHKGYSVKFLT